jgi:hypothetical protein
MKHISRGTSATRKRNHWKSFKATLQSKDQQEQEKLQTGSSMDMHNDD